MDYNGSGVTNMLSRREFIRDVGTATFAVVTGLEGLVLGDSESLAVPEKRITFEEAKFNQELAPKYIRQVLEEMFGNEVSKYFTNILHYKTSSQAKEAYKGLISDAELSKFDKATMSTIGKGPFGEGIKSDLAVLGSAFEAFSFYIDRQIFHLPSTEILTKARLEHEYLHAKDNFEGIKLEDGTLIGASDYNRIDPRVMEFLKETRSYIKQIEISRFLEKANPLYTVAKKWEELPPAYLASIRIFVEELGLMQNDIKREIISFEDARYVRHQLNQIRHRIPEIGIFKVVQDLYNKSKIR